MSLVLKILHLSDIHLGIETYGRTDVSTGLNSRLGDFLAAFDQAVEHALDEQVDLFLFTGDAFKNRDPNPTLQREFARRIRRLSEGGVSSFLLVGNHDLPNAASRATSIEIYDVLRVANVWVGKRIGTQLVKTRRGPVQMVSIPWIVRGNLLTKEEYRNLSMDELRGLMLQKVETALQAEVENLDRSLPAVLAVHGTVFGAQYGSERMVMLGQDAVVLPQSVVANPAFDYVALGHIHRHQVLSTSPLMLYPGSMQGIDFGEEGEPKGFVLVEIEKDADSVGGRSAAYSFVPVASRPFLTIRATATGEDPTAEVLAEIERHQEQVEGAVVRLLIATTAEREPHLRIDEIRQALRGAHYLAAVHREVDRSARIRLGARFGKELAPRELLEKYLEVKSVPGPRAARLLDYAGRLMGEAGDRPLPSS